MLPDPPEGLRHWEPGDAPALEAAWTDPEIVAWADPPEDLAAADWIAGTAERWDRGLALDLVVEAPGDARVVAGEVGLANFTADPTRAELGVWIAAPHRRRGLARRAVAGVTRWALTPAEAGGLGLAQVWARTHETNSAAMSLFAALGWRVLGIHEGSVLWTTTPAVLR